MILALSDAECKDTLMFHFTYLGIKFKYKKKVCNYFKK